MAYLPLARKYRPASFEDLVGQDSAAKALANGIRLGREPHAVIFSGVRGIGKTTVARLYAKALNCEKGPTPNPCGRCDSCLAVASCTHEDVMEIDGASNTSVDDIRQLRETVDYVPQRSRFKVYIIDEVHMLSNNAFNALLKTLEEPPAHVVFLFATTELQKIPQTIIGRCQTFYLKKFSVEQIASRLAHVLKNEGIAAEERVVREIAKRGNGSMRDALTFLDTAIAVSSGELTIDKIAELLSSVSSDTLLDLLRSMIRREPQRAMELLAQLDQQGVAFDELVEQLAEFSRHGFVLQGLQGHADVSAKLGIDSDLAKQLKSLVAEAKNLDLNRIFRSLIQCRTELDGSNLDRFVLENYVLEWCLDPGLPDVDTIRSMLGQQPAPRPAAVAPSAVSSAAVVERQPLQTSVVAQPPVATPLPAAAPVAEAPRKALRENWLNKAVTPTAATPAATAPDPVTSQTIATAPVEAVVEEIKVEAAPIPMTEFEIPPPPSKDEKSFPTTWREMVDEWQKKKPLQARIFEETYGVKFSPDEIVIAVHENSMASKLLVRDTQMKVLAQMRELFGFNGSLSVVSREEVRQGAQVGSEKSGNEDESVLDTKRREKEQRRENVKKELRENSATQSVLDIFGGRIESIEVIEP